jgi:hypothetical protein
VWIIALLLMYKYLKSYFNHLWRTVSTKLTQESSNFSLILTNEWLSYEKQLGNQLINHQKYETVNNILVNIWFWK